VLPVLTDDQIRRLDRAAPRYTSYPTVPAWSEEFGEGDYLRALDAASQAPDEPLSIYVHIPFCREMCTFCGCNALVSRSSGRADRYLDAIERELALVAPRLGARRSVSRIHLGGGTPTTLSLPQLERLWRLLTSRFAVRADAEVALEIDPAVTTTEQLGLLRTFGFNRISMGVQDFDPCVQKAVNRIQSVEETRRLVDFARASGYASVSLDLIVGLPKQSPAGWSRTLDDVLAMQPNRLAIFSFAYVPDLKPHQRRLVQADLPVAAAKAILYRIAYDRLVATGYQAIGLDHFAHPDDELAVADREGRLWRDFQGYTTLRAPDTIAFGMSGIGCVGGAYVQTTHHLAPYTTGVAAGRLPVTRGLWLTDDDHRRRAVITSIMCNELVDAGELEPDQERLAGCVADGLVELDGTHLRLTSLGKMFRRNVATCFDAYLARPAGRVTYSRTV
jgi:oxygen-independent coproporphyrinogen III oxidase